MGVLRCSEQERARPWGWGDKRKPLLGALKHQENLEIDIFQNSSLLPPYSSNSSLIATSGFSQQYIKRYHPSYSSFLSGQHHSQNASPND